MKNVQEFALKKREMTFRNRVWSTFEGNFYRNATEIPTIIEAFPVKKVDLLLEVGGGSGRFTKIFRDTGAEVIVVDISRASLKTNKQKTGCQALLADTCFLPFGDSTFDNAAALNVFQYVPSERSRLQGLNELRRTVKKGGLVAIEVYNYRLWDRLRKNGKEGFHTKVNPPIYYYRYSMNEIKCKLTSVFSKIVAVRPTLIFYPLTQITWIGDNPFIVKGFQLFEKAWIKSSFGELAYMISCCVACVCQK